MMREAGLVVGRPSSAARRRPARRHHRGARRDRRGQHPRPRRHAVLPGLPRLPRRRSAPRSTTRSCTASPDRATRAARRRHGLHRLRRDRRRLARRRRDHRAASARSRAELTELMRVTEESMWPASPPPASAAGSPTSRHAVETYVRASQRRLRHPRGLRRPRHRHRDAHGPARAQLRPARAAGPSWSPGHGLAVEPMVTLGRRHTQVLDDDWTGQTDDGTWSAHFEHTFALTDTAPGCSPPSTAARPKLAELGVTEPARRDRRAWRASTRLGASRLGVHP